MQALMWGRYSLWFYSGVCAGLSLCAALFVFPYSVLLWAAVGVFFILFCIGLHDYRQKQRAVRANYPLMGRMRYLLESIRPELRQYFWETDTEEIPYSRNQRAMVYQRSKAITATRPMGTVLDVYAEDHNWVNHSFQPSVITDTDFRVQVGTAEQPYAISLLNISGTSFGAMSPPAIQALNSGAKLGAFAHNTGEGAFSPYHQAGGGDTIWQISTGYFGCRTEAGEFCPERFAKTAQQPQIKMIEIKISQGAKPGHGGMLMAPKVTEEIAQTRGIKAYEDCISPARHSAFSTPVELLEFVVKLRQLSGGKPVGIKLCIGHPWEFLAIIKAMCETGMRLDFITIDGAEGGTGAAPTEFTDHVGFPLRDALVFAENALIGAGLRDEVKLAASGKIVSAYDIIRHCALGADWCNMARPFMFSLGCIQARDCASGECPTGLATMDPSRYRVVDVEVRAQRVANFHRNTLHAVTELLEATGLTHPAQLNRSHIVRRLSGSDIRLAEQIFPKAEPHSLINGVPSGDPRIDAYWQDCAAETFALSR